MPAAKSVLAGTGAGSRAPFLGSTSRCGEIHAAGPGQILVAGAVYGACCRSDASSECAGPFNVADRTVVTERVNAEYPKEEVDTLERIHTCPG